MTYLTSFLTTTVPQKLKQCVETFCLFCTDDIYLIFFRAKATPPPVQIEEEDWDKETQDKMQRDETPYGKQGDISI